MDSGNGSPLCTRYREVGPIGASEENQQTAFKQIDFHATIYPRASAPHFTLKIGISWVWVWGKSHWSPSRPTLLLSSYSSALAHMPPSSTRDARASFVLVRVLLPSHARAPTTSSSSVLVQGWRVRARHRLGHRVLDQDWPISTLLSEQHDLVGHRWSCCMSNMTSTCCRWSTMWERPAVDGRVDGLPPLSPCRAPSSLSRRALLALRRSLFIRHFLKNLAKWSLKKLYQTEPLEDEKFKKQFLFK